MTRRDCLLGAMALGVGAAEAQRETLARRLGYPAGERVLLIHADDVGMCHSANAATMRGMTEGVVSTASVMVPCPWFPAIARWSRENPTADLGLHLALTSEWAVYRWRPVTPVTEVPGLVDEEGYLWRSVEDVVRHAKPAEVETEIRAQIRRAQQFGMKPTHIDSHMGTLFATRPFFDAYLKVAREFDLVPMIPGPTPDILDEAKGLGVDYVKFARELSGQGFVILDRLVLTLRKDESYEARREEFYELLRDLKPGVTQLIMHLAMDDEEIRHISGAWKRRVLEGRLVVDPEVKARIQKEKVRLIGYRELRKAWRAEA